jgi:RimJ/RimL family protein N-acetyltransferase
MVEIGYAVDPAYRRRGYARAALEALLQRADHEPQVKTVRVTISPDNAASYALASQYGFVEIGEQWDEEDGLEIIYEVAASRHERRRSASDASVALRAKADVRGRRKIH